MINCFLFLYHSTFCLWRTILPITTRENVSVCVFSLLGDVTVVFLDSTPNRHTYSKHQPGQTAVSSRSHHPSLSQANSSSPWNGKATVGVPGMRPRAWEDWLGSPGRGRTGLPHVPVGKLTHSFSTLKHAVIWNVLFFRVTYISIPEYQQAIFYEIIWCCLDFQLRLASRLDWYRSNFDSGQNFSKLSVQKILKQS